MIVLGLHGGVALGQHEPSAALVVDGRVAAVCEEERYLRIKTCYGHLPNYAIKGCLEQSGIGFDEIDLVVTPGLTCPGFDGHWGDYLRHQFGRAPRIERVHHQHAHLASAFYGSGFDEALALSLDATGDASSGMAAHASLADGIRIIDTMPTQSSLGYFYTLITYYCGFADGEEHKLMGLAPFGRPTVDLTRVIHPTSEGWTFDWSFVRQAPPPRSPFEPLYSQALVELLGRPNRRPDRPIDDFYRNVAASAQKLMQECLLAKVEAIRRSRPDLRNFCYAGGVALNCTANRLLLQSKHFDHVYVSPVASDRGLALGCAYLGAVQLGDKPWPLHDVYLGSEYAHAETETELKANGCRYRELTDPCETAAELLEQRKIIGWHQGRSEAGASALGNRSILAACGDESVRDLVNARIKFREEFRPFAPSVLQERAGALFATEGRTDFPYMTFTLKADPGWAERMRAVVHADGTSRVQTVRCSTNELFHRVIRSLEKRTGEPAVLNTSFNLKGQPIVETPRDALMTYFGCGLDALIVGNFLVEKAG